jgi:hypothetical protein
MICEACFNEEEDEEKKMIKAESPLILAGVNNGLDGSYWATGPTKRKRFENNLNRNELEEIIPISARRKKRVQWNTEKVF